MSEPAVTVQVALRIRPLVDSEISKGFVKCLETVPNEPQVLIKDLSFTYNHVFPPEVSQAEFYETAVKGMVDKLFKGYNVTILAYGQTGSGKTHSMGTAYSGGPAEEMGVIPRAVKDIFQKISTLKDQYDFRLQVSFMELYQEQLFDLLSKANRDQSIVDIREDQQKGIVIPGLTEVKVHNATETLECLVRGSHRRAVGATAMNSQSSRSHAIFTVHIQQQKISDENSLTTCKFHLVDLAGSERANKTKATGNRFREGVKINEGLLALGNVISRLGEGCTGFIGYRDSKLTRLLQDSLGGNSVTLMIACVSPADYNLEETISTLRYADRARKIKNKPIINQDPKAAEIIRLKNTIHQLRMELLGKRAISVNGDNADNTDNNSEDTIKLQQEIKTLRFKNNNLIKALDSSVMEIAWMNEKVVLNEASNERMTQKLNELSIIFNEISEELNTNDKNVLQKMKIKIDEMQKEVKKASDDIVGHNMEKGITESSNKSSNNQDSLHLESSESVTDFEVETQQDKHLTEQAAMSSRLQELNNELVLKQTLVAQVERNHLNLVDYQTSIKENEEIIKALQKEREELLAQIRSIQSNAHSKLAEDRRKRVQALETEIATLQKKLEQQNKLLKIKEKNDLRIMTLNNEIKQIKASKVKLIRTMRTESENFRNWKITRERELSKLKDQDRKRANDMARMQHMFGKKNNVLKRKVEETIAINKRLKDALERQKTAQSRRLQIGPGKADQVRAWLEQEVDVVLSTIDAQKTLEQLMDDRAGLQQKLDALSNSKPLSNSNNEQVSNAHIEIERKQLQDDIAFRTAQISDLQEKIIASDQENKSKSRWDIVQSMGEAKYALKHLFDIIAESRRMVDMHKGRNIELEEHLAELTAKVNQCKYEMETIQETHKQELAEMEGEGEYKISVLLRQLRSNNIDMDTDGNMGDLEQRVLLQNRELERMDTLQSELDEYKRECEDLRERLQEKMSQSSETYRTPEKKAKKNNMKQEYMPMELTDSDEESIVPNDSTDKDPDFRVTPMYKRLQLSKSVPKRHAISAGVKRNSNGEIQCSCKGKCQNRMCGCRKINLKCGPACKCSKQICQNKDGDEQENVNIKKEDLDSTYKLAVPFKNESDTNESSASENSSPIQQNPGLWNFIV